MYASRIAMRLHMLNQIQVPTLILQGEDDAVCSLGAGLYLAEMIPNTQFDIFLGKGHGVRAGHR